MKQERRSLPWILAAVSVGTALALAVLALSEGVSGRAVLIVLGIAGIGGGVFAYARAKIARKFKNQLVIDVILVVLLAIAFVRGVAWIDRTGLLH